MKKGTARWSGGMGVPPMEEDLEVAGLWPMQDHTRRIQANIEEYITTRLIYELCTREERLQGTGWMMR